MAGYYKGKKIQVLREPKYRCEIRNPNIIGTQEVSGTYNVRQTGTGNPDVSDILLKEHVSYVKQIKGGTVKCKNLIPYPYHRTTTAVGGITFTDNGDGSITVNGTATATVTLSLYVGAKKLPTGCEVGKSYTISGRTAGVYIQVNAYRGGAQSSWNDSHGTKTKTLDESIEGFHIYLVVLNGTKVNKEVIYPMLNEGDTALPYQPYFTDLKHANINSIKSTGRNLFDSSLLLKADGWTENNGVYSGAPSFLYDIFKKANGGLLGTLNTDRQMTVAFSARSLSISGSTGRTLAVYIAYTDGTYSEVFVSGITAEFIRYSVTSTVGKTIDRIYFSYSNNGMVELKELCVKYGDDTTYEPYTEDIYQLPETLELGEYDSFNPQTGELSRATEKIILDGKEEFWNFSSQNDDGSCNYTWAVLANNAHPRSKNERGIYSNTNIGELKFTGYTNGLGYSTILLTKSPFTTVDELKSALSANPIDFEYEKFTPTIEKIENAPKQYKAWKHGSESVLQGETDNSVYGAIPAITQEYFVHKE